MTEWLILMLLVPAIVVPAVLLLGFAGCGFEGSGVATPTIESAVAKSDSIITLTWYYGSMEHVQFERTKRGAGTPVRFDAFSSPHDDTGLEAATTYDYVMRGYLSDGELSEFVSNMVSGTTFAFAILPDITQDGDFGNVDTHTVKCEIAVADFTVPAFAPTRMWITLGQRTTTAENITFSKVFIGHKAAAGDASDATALTQVFFGSAASVVIAPGGTSRSDEIPFAWDRTSALILSMYFAGGPMSDQLSARTTGSSVTHLKNSVDEAATADSTGYTPFPGYLSGVVKIEVA